MNSTSVGHYTRILFLTHLIIFADYVYKAIDALPVTSHPMTQFASGVMALQVCRSHSYFDTYVS